MESQNHYYGHSGAFARYVGLERPRHIRGLVQHGWTSVSPVRTHFRDFPSIGAPDGRTDRDLFVWSSTSRAWDPQAESRRTVAIGAPWLYLLATGTPPLGGKGTVILPVHGIPTQRLHGDHAAVARQWAESEGPSTVCLYHVEADDPRIVEAYRQAGHRCVTLGTRTDAAFLGRLLALLGGANRVVSNRLSTPLVYAAGLGVDVAVHGDAMLLDGEQDAAMERLTSTWPEFFAAGATAEDRRAVALQELGASDLREPEELRQLLGWDRRSRIGPWVDHWVGAPAGRAVTNVRRRRASTVGAVPASGPAAPGLGAGAWLHGALSYLPRPLGRVSRETAPLTL